MSFENVIQAGNSVLLYNTNTSKFMEGTVSSVSENKAVVTAENQEYEFSIAVTYSMSENKKRMNLIYTENPSLKCFTSEQEYQAYLNTVKENQNKNAKYSFIKPNSQQYAYAFQQKK